MDLRETDWREAIVEVADAIKNPTNEQSPGPVDCRHMQSYVYPGTGGINSDSEIA